MSKKYAVIGLGSSGLSAVRYLCEQGHAVAITDAQAAPALADQLPAEALQHFGAIDSAVLLSSDVIVISPGIDPRTPAVQAAKAAGIPVISDVQLFVDALAERDAKNATQTPIIAITGSNAKSTVTTLVGEMAKQAGICVGVGGNIGTPALELLTIDNMALAVLELSSFQLEHISHLSAKAATILNLSADHLDRHDGMQDYLNQKLRIFEGCQTAVICQDDPALARACLAALPADAQIIHTDSSLAAKDEFHLHDAGDGLALYYGADKLIDTQALKIKGKHNLLNALSALALGMAAGLDMPSMLIALENFKGLAHRCEYVDEVAGKAYFNDSKGTNIGSTLAAIDGLGTVYGEHSIALILGGLGKGQDFSELSDPVARWAGAVYLIGQDANLIEQGLLAGNERLAKIIESVGTLDAAVARASQSSAKVVLLSPACASMDQFKNYSERGDHFVKLVHALS
ncbi:UDP-N-acetylmuramoyl-L-alanine--D-glutamate ligase [Moraxella porci DSM 25326]|uniref:UDP-N-acetylmuramoylalanine--D-glutamate ligase n=1 Tax=Moraxella porci DSM 25326 TaxID=573983 RepID=A0A1T0CNC8_9GAMM|nr:UDP-N-acetylmuramoyl-L-alanine--D-glutamate ligase [Moraxella porci]OOS23835.1 UDP-N-acetylmuramoyl-L-alanine--D-glutamate ligase [Moraxella porci DSM 25326]